MISHSELAVLAARSYCGPQSGHVALDVRYDLIPREGEVIVVMPGTHPADALDWLRDLRAWPAVVGPIGPVHSGFGKGAAALWPELERDLPPYGLITYTGHSLGGALAQGLAAIHAQRWRDVRFRVVTFGAPGSGFSTHGSVVWRAPVWRRPNTSGPATSSPTCRSAPSTATRRGRPRSAPASGISSKTMRSRAMRRTSPR